MQTVADAYVAHGLELQDKTTEEKCGPCPVCGGRDRFVVFIRQNNGIGSWYCRGCDKGGDLIEFYRHCDGMSYHDACHAAGRQAPIPSSAPHRFGTERCGLIASSKNAEKKTVVQVNDRRIWQTKATEFVDRCAANLVPSSSAGRWLAARGLPPASWPLYSLGYNPGANGKPYLMRARNTWGLADGYPSRKSGKPRTALWLPRGVVIPRMVEGQATRLRIRRNNADLKGDLERMKYYIIPGSDMTPMLLPCRGGVLPPDTCALVVEAELDALAVHYIAGDLTLCLATMTAKLRHLPQNYLDTLRRCALILVATDYGDQDGAGADGWEIWQETFPQARRWPVPRGKDPGEAFALGVDLRAWVTAGLPPLLADMARQKVSTIPHEHGPAWEQPPEEKTLLLQEEASYRAERLENLRIFYPLHRLYYRWEKDAMRLCLEGHGLSLSIDGDDFRIYGHERWSPERRSELLHFVHRYGDILNDMAHEEAVPCI